VWPRAHCSVLQLNSVYFEWTVRVSVAGCFAVTSRDVPSEVFWWVTLFYQLWEYYCNSNNNNNNNYYYYYYYYYYSYYAVTMEGTKDCDSTVIVDVTHETPCTIQGRLRIKAVIVSIRRWQPCTRPHLGYKASEHRMTRRARFQTIMVIDGDRLMDPVQDAFLLTVRIPDSETDDIIEALCSLHPANIDRSTGRNRFFVERVKRTLLNHAGSPQMFACSEVYSFIGFVILTKNRPQTINRHRPHGPADYK